MTLACVDVPPVSPIVTIVASMPMEMGVKVVFAGPGTGSKVAAGKGVMIEDPPSR